MAGAAGQALGLAFGAAAAVRRKKPLHPRGVVVRARLERAGAPVRWDVPWLDEPGVDEPLVRFSRALGLPTGWPDLLGLALSFSDAGGRHDLLLATTGMARGARHFMIPRVHARSVPYSSLFTYVTPRGHAVLAAAPGREPDTFTLLAAPVLGRWHPFGTLRLREDPADGEDAMVDLDPVLNPLPQLHLAPLLALLREPSYAQARRRRPDSHGVHALAEDRRTGGELPQQGWQTGHA